MLLLSKDHQQRGPAEYQASASLSAAARLTCSLQVDRRSSADMSSDSSARSPWTGLSQFLPTTSRILEFSNCQAAA